MSRVLVTGAAGFIGSHVVDELLVKGYEVVAVDSLRSGKKENLPGEVDFHEMDIRDRDALGSLFQQYAFDLVIHEAAIINTNVLKELPREDVDVSVMGTLNLIDLSKKYGIKRIVFASSVAVYGTPEEKYLPVDESFYPRPGYSYGIAKKCAEDYFQYYAGTRGLSYGVARYVNIYGPRQPIYGEVGVIAIFSSLVAEKKALTVFGDGTQMRDFLYVKDAAVATVKLLESEKNLILNVGSGRGTTVNEVVEAFEKISADPIEKISKPLRHGEIGRFFCSNESAKKNLGWEPQTSLVEGLKHTLEYECSKGNFK